jgi:hypothetical protein
MALCLRGSNAQARAGAIAMYTTTCVNRSRTKYKRHGRQASTFNIKQARRHMNTDTHLTMRGCDGGAGAK